MRRDDALHYRGIPIYDNLNVYGSYQDELCVCQKCGEVDSYRYRLGIDHFPLKCYECEAETVYIFMPDGEPDDLDLFRMKNWVDGIGKDDEKEQK